MIENTVKSVRRKETVDDAYCEKLFRDINSLYRLDQKGVQGNIGSEKSDLGELPTESKVLIGALIAVWVGIGAYALKEYIKKKKTQ